MGKSKRERQGQRQRQRQRGGAHIFVGDQLHVAVFVVVDCHFEIARDGPRRRVVRPLRTPPTVPEIVWLEFVVFDAGRHFGAFAVHLFVGDVQERCTCQGTQPGRGTCTHPPHTTRHPGYTNVAVHGARPPASTRAQVDAVAQLHHNRASTDCADAFLVVRLDVFRDGRLEHGAVPVNTLDFSVLHVGRFFAQVVESKTLRGPWVDVAVAFHVAMRRHESLGVPRERGARWRCRTHAEYSRVSCEASGDPAGRVPGLRGNGTVVRRHQGL